MEHLTLPKYTSVVLSRMLPLRLPILNLLLRTQLMHIRHTWCTYLLSILTLHATAGPCQFECIRDETRANNREDCGHVLHAGLLSNLHLPFAATSPLPLRAAVAFLQSEMLILSSRASGLDGMSNCPKCLSHQRLTSGSHGPCPAAMSKATQRPTSLYYQLVWQSQKHGRGRPAMSIYMLLRSSGAIETKYLTWLIF